MNSVCLPTGVVSCRGAKSFCKKGINSLNLSKLNISITELPTTSCFYLHPLIVGVFFTVSV